MRIKIKLIHQENIIKLIEVWEINIKGICYKNLKVQKILLFSIKLNKFVIKNIL